MGKVSPHQLRRTRFFGLNSSVDSQRKLKKSIPVLCVDLETGSDFTRKRFKKLR
jgi:hypothetical protein